MFEDVEYIKPSEAFVKEGHSIVHIGIKKGQVVKGKRKSTPVTIEESVSKYNIDKLDALLIPGGCSPDHLRGYESAVNFVKDFFKTGKPIFAICHAPQILITADLLQGRKVTGWMSIVQDIKNAGAIYIDDEVVVDDNLISSRGPKDIPVFIDTALKVLNSHN
ncbi:MAG: type 1 glutamine amidotransferase [Methanobacterium sp. ERen5]|nr:MAG: type 1 glutamine amidotransferase [Methanobacterium sp. ERen5]